MKKQFMRITKAHNTKHRIMMTTMFSLFSLLIYADNYVYVCTGEGAYCKINSETAKTYSDEYSWMIEQMKLHVGEPELKEIKRPIWGWCEFSTISEEEDEIEESLNESMDPSGTLNVLLEIDIPRERLLITNYYRWQDCLGGRVISTDIIFDGFYYNLLNVNKTLQNPQIEELCQRYKKKVGKELYIKILTTL